MSGPTADFPVRLLAELIEASIEALPHMPFNDPDRDRFDLAIEDAKFALAKSQGGGG